MAFDATGPKPSKAREQAEQTFLKTQSQFLARTPAVISEKDAEQAARDAKTLRLRQLRLEKEANDEK
ncbi:hypothetical protein IFT84_06370 [Rhizobium sp. CFBP 8762]|uniref:hypothetical protein n=1 Tax=Rhizobium sp. CFBP 8762 TaxID=2775279 RepID=UPI00177D9715|nr:hypothetical protein [Rhizobium sp. CFBP 8762]MBD8554147.1 hypothetical protein [Rhizobium sp. CFBP 8762]